MAIPAGQKKTSDKKMAATPKEVKTAVKSHLKAKNITREKAAEKLGMGRQALTNLLSQKKFFSRKMANRLHQTFGYRILYLISGEGNLFDEETSNEEYSKKITELNSAIAQKNAEIASLKEVIVEQAKMLAAKKIVIIVNPNPESDDAQ